MPTRIDESPRMQQDRDRRADPRRPQEPRYSAAAPRDAATEGHGAHAGFDDELNPIDDELINTHGSER